MMFARFKKAALGLASAGALAASAQAAQMPPVPESIASQQTLRAGVRCDQPPYGYQDGTGAFAGVETDMARQIATWIFGSPDKVEFSCVTAENRIPQLNGRRVDLLIATLGVTPERQRVIDFTIPYRWGASGVLVHADSKFQKVAELEGHTVAMPKGSVQAKWFEDNMPGVKTLRLNTAADSLQALKQKRAQAYAHDAATLVVVAARDKSLRMLDDPYQLSDAAIGVRKGEEQWQAYLSAAIKRMHEESLFRGWVEKAVPEETRPYYLEVFETARPDRK
ncbi:transporter substrate-binding domain-containing protein [Orrella sp. JC864]|uniref:transporter substrate-binding domain-containing protein n=1 Tax=Orrella sp. JC864 TaxID=3120298 RepID=UPI00300A7CA0